MSIIIWLCASTSKGTKHVLTDVLHEEYKTVISVTVHPSVKESIKSVCLKKNKVEGDLTKPVYHIHLKWITHIFLMPVEAGSSSSSSSRSSLYISVRSDTGRVSLPRGEPVGHKAKASFLLREAFSTILCSPFNVKSISGETAAAATLSV